MSEPKPNGFLEGSEADLTAFASRRAAELDLEIPDACLPGVLENLRALRDHARIVEAWLKAQSP